MPHFFVNKDENVCGNVIRIFDEENYRHIARSLRVRIGEQLLFIDENRIQYKTVVNKITSSEIECKIIDSYLSKRDLDFDLYLVQSPLRSDSQLTIMEKSTELGVRGVFPVITDNCAVSMEIAKKKWQKWQKVMYEASKQCERATIPVCNEPILLKTFLDSKQDFDRIIVFGERSTEISLKEYLKLNPVKNGEKFLVIIGPEGGFSQREFDMFKKRSYPVISLGDLILKADTAVVTALGDIIYEYLG